MNDTDTQVQQLGYSIGQTCEIIPCSRSFLYRQMRAGNIRFTRHGTKVLFSRQAVMEFLGENPPAVSNAG